ncbi:pantothenate transporter, partial [Penicillium malachiteum]
VVFLIFGPVSIAWGVVLFFFLPTSPMRAWFLTERERKISVMRVASNHTGIENRKYKVYQVKEALMDIQVWVLCAQAFLQCIPGGGLTAVSDISFQGWIIARKLILLLRVGKLILTGMGYSSRESIVLSFPQDGVQLVSTVLAGAVSQIFPNTRCTLMITANVIVLIGSVLVEILYVNTIPYVMCMSLISSNIGGFTKKATCGSIANADQVMMFMWYSVGQIVAPQFFIASEAPRYPTGFRAFYISVVLMIVIEILLLEESIDETQGVTFSDFQDLTDKEHPRFRYVY